MIKQNTRVQNLKEINLLKTNAKLHAITQSFLNIKGNFEKYVGAILTIPLKLGPNFTIHEI